jgi:hypothetical protein
MRTNESSHARIAGALSPEIARSDVNVHAPPIMSNFTR